MEDISDGENGSKNIILNDTKEQTPEQSEREKEVNTGQAVEGYTIQLYSEGKIEKTYVIAYTDINDAKAPEALKGKAGYVFKEWNTKEDGSGEAYKPGDSISKLLKSENPAMQNLDSANTDSAVQDKKMGEMESEGLNPTVENAGNTAQILSAEEEKMESASLAEEPEWTEVRKHWFERNTGNALNCQSCKYALLCGGGCLARSVHTKDGFKASDCFKFKSVYPLSVNRAYSAYKQSLLLTTNSKIK